MWWWIILATLANRSLVWCNVESSLDNDLQDDQPDDSLYVYMDERALRDQKAKSEDKEERRRSALDKNFMRFGRSGNDLYVPQNHYEVEDLDYGEEFSRPLRNIHKNDNFMRFGRGKANYIRLGRDPYKYLSRDIRGKDKNYIRFGRSVPLKRSRRDVYDTYDQEEKRNRNMLRFGRNDNFMRFGRTYEDNLESNDNSITNQNASHVIKEKNLNRSLYPLSIITLLKQIAAKLRNENKCNDLMRLG